MLDERSYMVLQQRLVMTPDAGKIISGSGGLRKIRWGIDGKGKRGGLRIIYFHDPARGNVYMLYAYAKQDQEDLTAEQTKTLCRLVERELK